jgi:DNA integrity scanning protein DisA with diadenylate cyclase activity
MFFESYDEIHQSMLEELIKRATEKLDKFCENLEKPLSQNDYLSVGNIFTFFEVQSFINENKEGVEQEKEKIDSMSELEKKAKEIEIALVNQIQIDGSDSMPKELDDVLKELQSLFDKQEVTELADNAGESQDKMIDEKDLTAEQFVDKMKI